MNSLQMWTTLKGKQVCNNASYTGRVNALFIDKVKDFLNSNACRNSPRPSIKSQPLLSGSPESPEELMKS